MTKARDISRYGLGVGIQSASSVIAGVGITQLNFIGAGNTFKVSGGTVDIDIDGLTNTTNINTTGIITATSFSGTLTGNVNTTGIITATSFSGTLTGNVNTTGIITATGGFNIGIQSAGVDQAIGVITAINFIGSGNTFRYSTSTKTLDVSISGGGGGGVSTTGILTCRAIANSAQIFENITFDDTFGGQGTNYATIGPITIINNATVTIGAGATYVVI